MPIKLNGNVISLVRLDDRDVTSVKLNGVQVFPATKKWVYITYYSSLPNIYYHVYVEVDLDSMAEMITYLESNYPASNYGIGSNAIVYNSNDSLWSIFEVQNV